MNTMNMPGFTAEAALRPTLGTHYKSSTKTTARGMVIPQARKFGECYDACRDAGGGRLRCWWRCVRE